MYAIQCERDDIDALNVSTVNMWYKPKRRLGWADASNRVTKICFCVTRLPGIAVWLTSVFYCEGLRGIKG